MKTCCNISINGIEIWIKKSLDPFSGIMFRHRQYGPSFIDLGGYETSFCNDIVKRKYGPSSFQTEGIEIYEI